MQIHKVQLENYRVHKSLEVDFDKGLNLILGKNGSGKSSILEAVGLALLGIEPRTSNTDTVTTGAKYARIIVHFTASDQLRYRVEKRIGQTPNWKLFVDGESEPRATGNKDVQVRIASLIGIEKNSANLYKHVITAYQNKLTEVFQLSDTERAKIFNQIFDTEIYRNIFDGLSKTTIDRYEKEETIISTQLLDKNSSLKNDEELKIKCTDIQDSIEKLDTAKTEISQNLEHINSQKTQLESLKHDIEKFDLLLKQSDETLTKLDNTLKSAQERLSNANNAKKTSEDNHDNYNAFIDVNQQKIEVEQIKKKLDSIKDDKLNKEKTLSGHQNKIVLDTQLIESNNLAIQKNQTEIDQLQNLTAGIQSDITSDQKTITELQNEISKFKKIQNAIDDFKTEIDIIENKINQSRTRMAMFQSRIVDDAELEERLKATNEIAEELKVNINNKQTIEKEIESLKSRLDDNEEASKILSSGSCPFLQQECENLKHGSSPDDYFIQKSNLFQNEIDAKNASLKEIGNPEKELADINQALGEINIKIEENKNNKLSLNRCIDEQKSFNDGKEKAIKDFHIALLEIDNKISFNEKEFDIDQIEKESRIRIESLNKDYVALNTTNENKKKQLLESTQRTEKLTSENKLSQEKNNTLRKEITSLETQVNTISTELSRLNEQLLPFDETVTNLTAINTKLTQLKPAYDLYLQNIKTAGTIPNIESEILDITKQIKQCEEDHNSYQQKLISLNNDFSQDKLDIIVIKLKEINDEKERISQQIGSLESEYKSVLNEIESNEKIKNEVEELKQKIGKVTLKKAMTKVFRDNIKDMGKHVAARKLNSIALTATTNYQSISGKPEVIAWVNDDTNTYQVLLKNSKSDSLRKFEMLSGGEQVSVAIAIRSAIASTMTQSNLAIFDEPTVNLDSERRLALADSLKSMLDKLEQAIIVTHDDTFREMAQKTIEL